MNVTYQRICAWCGPGSAFLWVIALLVFARFIPPLDPAAGAGEIAQYFATHTTGIRWGMVFLLIGGVLYQPWVAVISVQMKRMEGRESPMTYVQLGLGTLFVLLFVLAAIFWQVAAFRPLEDPVFTQRFDDLGWFMFLISVPIITVQGLSLSLAIFGNPQESIFPRWFAWFNIWAQIVFLPGTFIPFFKAGPVAWNGAISFWIPVPVYTIWMCLVTALMLRGFSRRARTTPDVEASRNGHSTADEGPEERTENARTVLS